MKISVEGVGGGVVSSRSKLELMVSTMSDGLVFDNTKMRKETGMTLAAARNLKDTNSPYYIMYEGKICWANEATVKYIGEQA